MPSLKSKSAKKLKIGLVLDSGLDKPDGVQQYILAIGEWLRSQGQEVRYLVGETKRTDIAGLHSLSRNIAVRSNGNRGTIPLPTSTAKLRSFLRAEEFDILHIQVPYSPFMAHKLVLSANNQTAIIGTFHIAPNDGLVTLGTRALGVWLRTSLQRFDVMLSVSSAAADFARRTFGVESLISPNVIDYQRFHDAQPLSRYQDKRLTILFLGRLVPRKGCQVLLQALAGLVDKPGIPPFRAVICGDGPLRAKLEDFTVSHGLADIVEFTGFIEETEKPRYYASADISVFPSSGGESFGIVLLEAMASGHSAVLAGDNPGYRSVLVNRPQMLFDPSDPQALAALIETHLVQRETRTASAAWGERFSADFDVNRIGHQLLKIYTEALRKRRRQ